MCSKTIPGSEGENPTIWLEAKTERGTWKEYREGFFDVKTDMYVPCVDFDTFKLNWKDYKIYET